MPALYLLWMILNVLGMVSYFVKMDAPPKPDFGQSIYISNILRRIRW